MKITRRDFVKKGAAVGLALGVPASLHSPFQSLAAPKPTTTLSMVTGDTVPATRKALELLGGMGNFVKRGQRVVMKPNMSWARTPDTGANTHPDVVATIARMCLDAGAGEVLVLDHTINRPKKCLELTGIEAACKGIKNVYTFAVNEEKFFRAVTVSRAKALRTAKIIKDVLDGDVFINIPCAKSHTTTGVTLGMKNLMGIVWDRKYFHTSVDINQAIADLTSAVKIDLTVLDASRAMVTGGPAGPGKVTRPRTIVAGTDPVAVDAMGVSLADWYDQRFTGNQVEHIAAAHSMGLGTLNLQEVSVLKADA